MLLAHFLFLSRQHTLMFAMTLIIRGEQKVSMNKQKLLVFQLLLLPAYIQESAMVIFFLLLVLINFFVCPHALMSTATSFHKTIYINYVNSN